MTPEDILLECAGETGLASDARPFRHSHGLAEAFSANPFLMAPMAGVSDAAWRLMARAGGAALAYTEMISVNGLHYGDEKTWSMVDPCAGEPDVAVQLFGSDPALFAEAVTQLRSRLGSRLALVDVNMACPVPKVVRGGAGSALLDDPKLAAEIVRSCVGAAGGLPVTVKIRAGRRAGEEVAPEFARAMADVGAQAVAVHGRTASQLYRGQADWGVVSRVASALDVPVIGSGDVRNAGIAATRLRESGCAAIMVARGSYGNPWIFADARQALAGRTHGEPGTDRRLAALACHIRLLDATGAHLARARSIASWYLRGMPHAGLWRDKAMRCETVDDYLAMVESLSDYVDLVGLLNELS